MTKVKKGKPSWKPASRLNVTGVPDGYVPRWVDKESGNYQKKLADGWEPVNGVTNSQIEHEKPDVMGDGKQLTSSVEYRDMQLMVLPKEEYEAHRAYYREQTEAQTAGLRRQAEQENAKNAKGSGPARLYGKTIIE